jgi:hypothetical protein
MKHSSTPRKGLGPLLSKNKVLSSRKRRKQVKAFKVKSSKKKTNPWLLISPRKFNQQLLPISLLRKLRLRRRNR